MHQLEDSDIAEEATDHETLFDRYCPVIFTYLRKQIASREDAEDLTLDVFAAALENPALPTWSGPRQLAWLKRVARNKLVNSYRHTRRHPATILDENAEAIPDPDEPEHIVLRDEGYRQLYQSIQQLPPLQQQLLHLRYGQGLAITEIAALLQKSDQAIRQLLSRTIGRLRTIHTVRPTTKGEEQ